ncbi:thioredoxin-disulfide reductase [Candidatus Peregrinibacteria bacterium CG_4_10_14_0_2_um_filter_38_24]|nr:MAG: thioredoxin-disulfide reductase [Candidatus Peregrinibacteria bacterium CG_4_10_14_0_2_um_filter_38_24]
MYDLIIIGGGVSGLSAAMYGTRLGLKTLTFAEMPGGLITTTHLVENWPGVKSISGPDLAMSLYDHATHSGAEIKTEKVIGVSKSDENVGHTCPIFTVKTASAEYQCKSVLFSTGTHHKNLGVPGEKEFENKGVSYCALCDGAFYKGKIVAIVGGGDAAAKEALFLTEHASKVYIIVRSDVLRAEPINAKSVETNPKIEVLYNTEIEEILGSEKVEKIKFKAGKGTYSGKELELSGVFLAIGHIAQTALAKDLGVELNNKGEIKINKKSETNLVGIFAAGDCTDTEFKQAITGSAEAVTAAYYSYRVCKSEEANF